MKHPSIQVEFPGWFVDPVTKLPPIRETELSARLWLSHQRGEVDWSRVRLRDANQADTGLCADSIFRIGTILCHEYPLLSTYRNGGRIWGDMRADLMLQSGSGRAIAIVECKLTTRFTSGGVAARTGQLARLARYLERYGMRSGSTLLLICPRIEDARSRFSIAMQNALKSLDPGGRPIRGHLIFWEEIASALRWGKAKNRNGRN